jgi:hypothetical protein
MRFARKRLQDEHELHAHDGVVIALLQRDERVPSLGCSTSHRPIPSSTGSGHPDVAQASEKVRGERVAPSRFRKMGRTDWMGCMSNVQAIRSGQL